MLSNQNKGFTLIELLIVIAIIGILAALVIVNITRSLAKARDAQRKNDLRQLQNALAFYYDENGKYPPGANEDGTATNLYIWSSWQSWTTTGTFALGTALSKYIKKMPVDPLNKDRGECDTKTDCHMYKYCGVSDNSYILIVNLEIENNQSTSPADCTSGGPNNYWVTSP